VLVEGTCTYGGGLMRRACRRPAAGACVYCGEPFCADHGARGEDYIEVCHRKTCQAKWRDVRAHQAWRERAGFANRTSMCANEGCEERMAHRCQRCMLMFCAAHLRPRTIVERHHDGNRQVSVLLCPHCISRRELWD
jgi:predicted nucleic acid binding AN1-type Zn finger protein